jgi:plasmid stability protein
MSKMIQLRNVPDALHRKLKARAAEEGLALSDFLIREAERLAERPSLTELQERLSARQPVSPRVSAARAVRLERER